MDGSDQRSDVDPGRTDAQRDRKTIRLGDAAERILVKVRGRMKRARDLRDAGVARKLVKQNDVGAK
jgi:hypothetical protein